MRTLNSSSLPIELPQKTQRLCCHCLLLRIGKEACRSPSLEFEICSLTRRGDAAALAGKDMARGREAELTEATVADRQLAGSRARWIGRDVAAELKTEDLMHVD